MFQNKEYCDKVPKCSPEKELENARRLFSRIRNMDDIRISGGPFHYMIRSSSYGEQYDEPAWELDLGVQCIQPRSGLESNPLKCKYEKRVLVNNWVEERRDRQHVKYDNSPKLSEYAYLYNSEYGSAYTRPLCNKARASLLEITSFPKSAFPGHQPELRTDVLCSFPKPESCTENEDREACKLARESEKRYEAYEKEMSGEL